VWWSRNTVNEMITANTEASLVKISCIIPQSRSITSVKAW
jgi:hypothetical protein